MTPESTKQIRFSQVSANPNNFWIRYAPTKWAGPSYPWLNLATGDLGQSGTAPLDISSGSLNATIDDVVYLPPVRDEHLDSRKQLARKLISADVPVLVHYVDEDLIEAGGTAVVDLLDPLLARNLEPLSNLPSGCVAVWPLIGGYTDNPELWTEGVARLAEAGIAAVQGVALDLDPAQRRQIVDWSGDSGFDALFHGVAPSERDFSRLVCANGLEPFLARPLSNSPHWLVGNRRIAEMLASIGELWLRLGRGESTGQAFYVASRRIDSESHDISALSREGNLRVLDWLGHQTLQEIDAFVSESRSSLLEELRRDYLEKT